MERHSLSLKALDVDRHCRIAVRERILLQRERSAYESAATEALDWWATALVHVSCVSRTHVHVHTPLDGTEFSEPILTALTPACVCVRASWRPSDLDAGSHGNRLCLVAAWCRDQIGAQGASERLHRSTSPSIR